MEEKTMIMDPFSFVKVDGVCFWRYGGESHVQERVLACCREREREKDREREIEMGEEKGEKERREMWEDSSEGLRWEGCYS